VIRQTLALVPAVVMIVAGSVLLALSQWRRWFETGLALYLYGQAFFYLARPSLDGFRRRVRISRLGALRTRWAIHAAAGILFVMSAVTSLKPAFAALVTCAVLCWTSMIGWAVWRSRGRVESESDADATLQ
jgi:hypothetical protein